MYIMRLVQRPMCAKKKKNFVRESRPVKETNIHETRLCALCV